MQKTSNKSLGFWTLFSLVCGNVIGAGIFIIPASLAQYGSISLFSWVLTLIGSLSLAFVFSFLNKSIPGTGGPFLYARQVFGDFLAFAVVYTYWLAWCIAIASMVLAIPGYLAVIFPVIKTHTIYSYLIEVACVWLVTLINLNGIKAVGKMQLITMILKVVPLLTIGIVGLYYIQWHHIAEHFIPTHLTPTQSILGAMTITLWAFIGIESGTIPADKNTPSKTISRATIFGTLSVGIIYILCTFTLMGLFPAETLKNSISPFSDAALFLFGPVAATIVAISAVISIVGAINGAILIQTLGLVAAAKVNLGPKSFTYTKKNNVSYIAFLTAGITITALLTLSLNHSLIDQFHRIVMISTLVFLIPYIICCLAAGVLIFKYRQKYTKKYFIANLSVIALATTYAFWAMIGAGIEMIFYGSLFFFAAMLLYIVVYWQKWSRQLVQAK